MNTDINVFKKKLEDVTAWLGKEFSNIRTGRATMTLLDGVMVESYGTKTPINQVASVNVEDPKTIRIMPWDKSMIKEIDNAISKSDLGVSVLSDAMGVRVKFPDLTSETRENLVKQAHKKTEEAKISIRNERGDIIKAYEKLQKEGGVSEDDLKRKKDEIQKLVDDEIRKLDEKLNLKETEIRS
jgi:ribosome recycling factor